MEPIEVLVELLFFLMRFFSALFSLSSGCERIFTQTARLARRRLSAGRQWKVGFAAGFSHPSIHPSSSCFTLKLTQQLLLSIGLNAKIAIMSQYDQKCSSNDKGCDFELVHGGHVNGEQQDANQSRHSEKSIKQRTAQTRIMRHTGGKKALPPF